MNTLITVSLDLYCSNLVEELSNAGEDIMCSRRD
jgi:hypothetical protein